GAVVYQLLDAPLAQCQQLRDHTDVLVGGIDGHALDRLVNRTVDLARHYLWLSDRELEALAAHQLDEHGKRELAATLNLPRVGALRRVDAERHIADQLGVEAGLDLARRKTVAVLAGERRGVDPDRDRQR